MSKKFKNEGIGIGIGGAIVITQVLIFLIYWVHRAYGNSAKEATFYISVPKECEYKFINDIYLKYDCLNEKSFKVKVEDKND